MTARTGGRGWTILRQRLANDVVGLPVVWGLFVAAVALFAATAALLGPGRLQISAWEQAAQLARWFAGGMGVYLTAVYLPLYIAHGCTRRQFAAQLPALTVSFAAAFGLLMTIGYAIETIVYRGLGWSQELSGAHLYETPTQYPLIFTEFFVIALVWTVAGAVLGAAFYRRFRLGAVLLPVALLMVGLIEIAAGSREVGGLPRFVTEGWMPLIGGLLEAASPGATALMSAGLFVVGLALVWALIRDLPVRTKSA